MDYKHLLSELEKASLEKKLQFYSSLAHDVTVRARELYALQNPSAYYKGFNEIQHNITGHIVTLATQTKGYSEASMIKILSQGPWVEQLAPALEYALDYVSKRTFKNDTQAI